jgi:hypothetical protein
VDSLNCGSHTNPAGSVSSESYCNYVRELRNNDTATGQKKCRSKIPCIEENKNMSFVERRDDRSESTYSRIRVKTNAADISFC